MKPGSPLGLRTVPNVPNSTAVEELLMLTRIVGGSNANEVVGKMLTDLHAATAHNEQVLAEVKPLLTELTQREAAVTEREAACTAAKEKLQAATNEFVPILAELKPLLEATYG